MFYFRLLLLILIGKSLSSLERDISILIFHLPCEEGIDGDIENNVIKKKLSGETDVTKIINTNDLPNKGLV